MLDHDDLAHSYFFSHITSEQSRETQELKQGDQLVGVLELRRMSSSCMEMDIPVRAIPTSFKTECLKSY